MAKQAFLAKLLKPLMKIVVTEKQAKSEAGIGFI
jgi:hypothetical protein